MDIDSPDTMQQAFEEADFTVSWHNEGRHFKAEDDDLVISAWPNALTWQGCGCKWMVFGKVFPATPETVLRYAEEGRFVMPDEAEESECRSCGEPIWWVVTAKGKNMPLDDNGEAHFNTCGFAG